MMLSYLITLVNAVVKLVDILLSVSTVDSEHRNSKQEVIYV